MDQIGKKRHLKVNCRKIYFQLFLLKSWSMFKLLNRLHLDVAALRLKWVNCRLAIKGVLWNGKGSLLLILILEKFN